MRRRALIPAALTGVGVAIGLASCSQSAGLSLARQACGHVERSIRLFDQSERTSDPNTAGRLAGEAHSELLAALPIAAAANSDDGRWNALMTTISEISSVPESHLVVALTAQCRLANSQSPYQGPAGAATSQPGNRGSGGVPTTPPTNVPTTPPTNVPTTSTSSQANSTTLTTSHAGGTSKGG